MAGTEEEKPIPNVIVDNSSGNSYLKQRFFGKGGFARCYEIRDSRTNRIFAGKIVSKKTLTRENQKEKMVQEIEIHKNLSHRNVVKFYSFFEDSNFVYVILELCTKRSMMELHKRRKALTEPEVRYFMKQILEGVTYLHDLRIIHRDLKLGNLFLNEDLVVKIGDFGLAARIEFAGQRKKTLCGTPNYIAPEVLSKQGHGLEVDIWSIGCIMYTLIVGRPPFETSSLRETYAKIKRCEYNLPPSLDRAAGHMIHQMLLPDPLSRPKTRDLLNAEFLKNGFCPKELPPSVVTTAPKFTPASPRKPLVERNDPSDNRMPKKSVMFSGAITPTSSSISQQCHQYLRQLKQQLYSVLSKNVKELPSNAAEELTDPNAQPFVWVSKWVDYSDKYGFGYQLCDDCVGVMFNDHSRILLLPNMVNLHYIEQNGKEHYYTLTSAPPELEKKVKLLSYFRRYMSEHLMKAGESMRLVESDNMSRVPYLHQWNRSNRSVLMQLTNGTVQINFMDHAKIIMCPLMQAVTYLDGEKRFRTYRFNTILETGAVPKLMESLQYAYTKICGMLKNGPDGIKDV